MVNTIKQVVIRCGVCGSEMHGVIGNAEGLSYCGCEEAEVEEQE